MTKKKAIYTIDGKPARLSNVRSEAQGATLKEALGDYISAKDAHKAGIKDTTLRSWRNRGKIRTKKVESTWFYSRQDLLDLIKTSKS
jgi:hypothetical protein